MTFLNILKRLKDDDSGAVTVDWVVLTAAIVGLGVAVLGAVTTGTDELSGRISEGLQSQEVDGAPASTE